MFQIEPLEGRIAPATILPGGKAITYIDVDGDRVTISSNVAIFNFATTVFDVSGDGPQQLQTLDVREGSIGNFNITMTVKRGPEGDGQANVGFIWAGSKDLGTVTIKGDLGRIIAGDDDGATPGVKALNVNSLGAFGTDTQQAMGSTFSEITGPVGSVKVKTDVAGSLRILNASEPRTGNVGTITVGGSVTGVGLNEFGRIEVSGDAGTITVKGDLRGGDGIKSGQIVVNGKAKSIVVAGSILGGDGGGNDPQSLDLALNGSGAIIVGLGSGGTTGSITVGRDVNGGNGHGSGSIVATGEGSLGTVLIKGSVRGGDGNYSGRVSSEFTFGKLTINGSVFGGEGDHHWAGFERGQIYAGSDMMAVLIKGDLLGADGNSTGRIHVAGRLPSVTVGGTLFAGDGEFSGSIDASQDLGTVVVKRSVVGDSQLAGIYTDGSIASLKIGGSVEGGFISSRKQLGPISVTGDVFRSQIFAAGLDGAIIANPAIKSISVGGTVRDTEILAGYDAFFGGDPFVNGDAQIGSVTVKGDWVRSSISAGIQSTNAYYGDTDDAVAGLDDAAIISSIASIAIGGQVIGSTDVISSTDSFAFIAQRIGSFKVGGVAFALDPDPGVDLISLSHVTGDVRLREFPVINNG